jgi:hypothetical protein
MNINVTYNKSEHNVIADIIKIKHWDVNNTLTNSKHLKLICAFIPRDNKFKYE